MNGFLFLLYCIEILSAQLCGADTAAGTEQNSVHETAEPISTMPSTSENSGSLGSTQPQAVYGNNSTSPTPGSNSSATTTAVTTTTTAVTSTTITTGTTTTHTFVELLFKKDCLPLSMVASGLILACGVLLVSTLMLTCKVCQLSRQLKARDDTDLDSSSENWMGNVKKIENKSDSEAKETTVLMAEINQIQEDMDNVTTKEEGEKVNEDEQLEEANKKKVEDAANSEEASTDESKKETPAAVVENSSTSQSQDDATNSPSSVVAASSSEGAAEPKDVV